MMFGVYESLPSKNHELSYSYIQPSSIVDGLMGGQENASILVLDLMQVGQYNDLNHE